jgi:phospholipase/carboxylesterase
VTDELERERGFGEAIGRIVPQILAGLDAVEQAFRQLHPPAFAALRLRLAPIAEAVAQADLLLAGVETPPSLIAFREDLEAILGHLRRALEPFVASGPGEAALPGVLAAMHEYARAQARLYPLQRIWPAVSDHFYESFRRGRSVEAPASDASPSGEPARAGLFRAGEAGSRGGFELFVPQTANASTPRPLVVALHGASGSGSDFLWTWLREARSRDFLLLAPTSVGTTWSLHAPAIDETILRRRVERIAEQWPVDREHVLLTGLSDGATMTLLVGAAPDSPFTHLAPISGVLHPANFANGNLDRLRGKPVHLVHGALDWLFPVALAREAARVLERAGADLVYREIADLSHTHPREENARIIEWLDPRRSERALGSGSTSSIGSIER